MSKKYLKGAKPEKNAKSADMKLWLGEVVLAEKDQRSYLKRSKEVVKRYRDEDRGTNSKDDDLPARFNVLWANTETIAPMLFAKTPKVQVDRRYKDADPIGRTASQIWERSTQFSIDNYDFSGVLRAVVKDLQLAGRGTAWARYEPSVTDDRITYQEVSCDYVHYTDFIHAPGKQWRGVRWVGRKIYLTRKQLVDRFGNDIGSKVGLDYSSGREDDDDDMRREDAAQDEFKQARIYEIWDSESMDVIWLAKSYPNNILDKQRDPLGLHDFYPTPKPLYATTSTETLIPIPDYCLYQDQARELDQITMKIALLTDSLRMVGFYNAQYNKELGSLFQETRQNEMIPIQNWQAIQQAGGIKGVSEWMEIGQIIEAMSALYSDRDKVKQDIYELTGMADIMRGSNSGMEVTATERKIQQSVASNRMSDRQRDVERYARDLIAIQGEIIAEHFEPETIAAMTGYDVSNPEVQQQFMPAVMLLKNDPMRTFRISIETDSMVALDEATDKQQTQQFMTAFGSLLESSMKALQTAPVLAPMLGEIMMFTVRRFNAGRSVEGAIEQGMEGLTQMAQQALQQPQKPDPEVMKVQAQTQLEQTKSQNDFVLKKAEMEQKAQLSASEMQGRMALEQEKTAQTLALQRDKMVSEMELAREKAQQEINIKHAELESKDNMEMKKEILKAKIPNLHLLSDGTMTTHPIIIKEGAFDFDPATGKRIFKMVERPVSAEGEELGPTKTRSGVLETDPVTGQRRGTIIETPIQADAPQAQS